MELFEYLRTRKLESTIFVFDFALELCVCENILFFGLKFANSGVHSGSINNDRKWKLAQISVLKGHLFALIKDTSVTANDEASFKKFACKLSKILPII